MLKFLLSERNLEKRRELWVVGSSQAGPSFFSGLSDFRWGVALVHRLVL